MYILPLASNTWHVRFYKRILQDTDRFYDFWSISILYRYKWLHWSHTVSRKIRPWWTGFIWPSYVKAQKVTSLRRHTCSCLSGFNSYSYISCQSANMQLEDMGSWNNVRLRLMQRWERNKKRSRKAGCSDSIQMTKKTGKCHIESSQKEM